jgi:hypothetical protein
MVGMKLHGAGIRILAALFLCVLLSAPCLAESPAGTYYLAAASDHKEMLLIFREGGVFQMSVMVKDGREVYQGNWSRKGDQLTITYRAETKDCAGTTVPPQTFVQTFARGAVGLSLTRGDVHRLFHKATAAQVDKVLAVNRCN